MNLAGNETSGANDDNDENGEEEDMPEIGEYETPEDREKLRKKIGTKKLLKLEAKAEKRAMNEQMQREREERKEREKEEEEKRKKQDELNKKIEKELEEKEKRLKEEQERREEEEYLKLKQEFQIVDEGQDESMNEMNEQNLLEKFVEFIKKSKVVILEDLAAEFKLKTQVCVFYNLKIN